MDLAKIYEVETKRLKESVRRNIHRFPEDFMFELTREEWFNLRSQFASSSWGGSRYLPIAFTEQGVAMLSSVLNSEKAISMNIAIMRAFVMIRQWALTYQNQVINAIKLFYRNRFNRSMEVDYIQRPRREKRLPNVLSKSEVKAILASPTNLKHRAMLSLIYACGLRRGELLHLRLADIHSDRHLLFIHQSKGKKDRMAPISQKVIDLLRDYYKAYKPRTWLFEGQSPGEPYSERSLQLVLKGAVKKAGNKTPISLHWLRHSYATHLLESGTDIRYIQELLGHSSSKTTEIYTHVCTKNLQRIRSPFDDL